MRTSRQAIWVGWGLELIYLYNDPYQSIIGGNIRTRWVSRPRRFGEKYSRSSVRMLAESHHGSVSAESPGPNLGSTIIVCLPLTNPAASESERSVAPHANGSRALAIGQGQRVRRVLFVEDHEPTRAALTRLLQRRGYIVTVPHHVAAALAQGAQGGFDVLISDLGLPDGDGCELTSKLRANHASLPGIALSGFGMDADLSRSRAAGFEEHLTKPVSIDSLDRALARLLERPVVPPAQS